MNVERKGMEREEMEINKYNPPHDRAVESSQCQSAEGPFSLGGG